MVKLTVCTYNLMLPVRPPLRFNGQGERCRLLPVNLGKLSGQNGGIDVFVFQELIPAKYQNYIISAMEGMGWVYSTRSLTSRFKPVSGGIFIVSKYPLSGEVPHIFNNSSHLDQFVNKGIIYAKCHVAPGFSVHLFALHLQAWDTPECRNVRIQQLGELDLFIKQQDISKAEPVVVAGDFNIDYYTQRSEIDYIAREIGLSIDVVSAIHQSPFPFSIDPRNNKLVGNDSGSMYKTDSYPEGCYADYLNNMRCPCCPCELLDFVLYSKSHLAPAYAAMEIVPLKTARPFRMNVNVSTERKISDLSDHYPVITSFRWDAYDTGGMEIQYRPVGAERRVNRLRLLVIAVFVILGILLLKSAVTRNSTMVLNRTDVPYSSQFESAQIISGP